MSTLRPRPPYSPQELDKLYPKELELQQVQFLLRHGERTPVTERFRNAGLHPHWPYCSTAKTMVSAVMNAEGTIDALQWKRRLEAPGNQDAPTLNAGPKGEVDTMCSPGQLTDRGRETTLALGQRLRQLYVDRLGFLPPTIAESSSVYLRATPIERALESVQQAFVGLYPGQWQAPGLQPPTIVQRAPIDETLFPNEWQCKRFRELLHQFADRTAELYNDGPELANINKKIGKWMPSNSPVVKVNSHPRLSGIMDTLNASDAHGSATKLPKEFYDESVRADIDKVVTEEWFIGYQESNEYRKLGIGAMVGDLTQHMVEHATASESAKDDLFKISLAGCHDTTLAATLTALGAMDATKDKWPKFTSNIAFELFKKREPASKSTSSTTSGAIWPSKEKTWWHSPFSSRSTPNTAARTPLTQWSDAERRNLDDYYVRLRYNDDVVTIPYCKPADRHFEDDESFCTLSGFKEAVDSFTPADWKSECSMNLGKPITGADIERPPGLQ